MVVEAGLRCLGKLEVGIEGGTNKLRVSRGDYGLRGLACLNSFSSSMTCIPFSYCSLVGASPTFAKWPFIVITEGAVGNLEAVEGLLVPWPFVVEDIVEEERKRDTNNNLVMDVEGTDGRERGEDQDFERKSALFALATSEVLIVNIWEHQVGLYQGANMGLLKTVFEVNLQLFLKDKQYVLRLHWLRQSTDISGPIRGPSFSS